MFNLRFKFKKENEAPRRIATIAENAADFMRKNEIPIRYNIQHEGGHVEEFYDFRTNDMHVIRYVIDANNQLGFETERVYQF